MTISKTQQESTEIPFIQHIKEPCLRCTKQLQWQTSKEGNYLPFTFLRDEFTTAMLCNLLLFSANFYHAYVLSFKAPIYVLLFMTILKQNLVYQNCSKKNNKCYKLCFLEMLSKLTFCYQNSAIAFDRHTFLGWAPECPFYFNNGLLPARKVLSNAF